MKLKVDSHTHTLASAHAYSTILENAQAAAKQDLELLVLQIMLRSARFSGPVPFYEL